MVRLIERNASNPFETFHMDGHWDATGMVMVEGIRWVLGDPQPRVAPLPWWLLRVASLFSVTPRELMKMRYLWQQPVRLDNGRLVATLGGEPHTPLTDAVRQTLIAMRCIV